MPNKFARSNGDFNNAAIWSLSATGLSATTVPTIGDNAIANTFTIQITGNVACDLITNNTAYGGTAGGTFNLNNNSQLSSIVTASGPSTVYQTDTIVLSGANTSSIFAPYILQASNLSQQYAVVRHTSSGTLTIAAGTITGGVNIVAQPCDCVIFTGSGILDITGNLVGGGGGSTGACVRSGGIGSVVVRGNILGGSTTAAPGIINTSTGPVTVYGNLNGATASALSNTSTGSVTVYGNLNSAAAAALSNTSTGPLTIVGNIIGDSRSSGIASSNAAANVRISGNLIGAPNGIPAVYAASYTVNPVPYQTYIRYANNGTGVGSDAYLYHYTTDSLSAFSIPPVSAVRAGLQYANNTLTGTCEMPAASAVTFGALVGNTTGTATLTSNTLFDVSVASLTASDSLGARLKNSATVESVGRIIASFSN